ncbi:putative HVA22-like protein g isoform X2 [Syzygium oleosum]|uniref:putative HVA22-like protein g isoform X2 n=1 Tax=Syzygium oleosum TaxID=219896 RepID=UPI0024BA5788|nr:putative HVA22-like protein g isoform X2 [Syzygium oleosum]
MLGNFITRCLLLVLGYAYPAFQCYKTVEKNRVQIDELRHWCQYWSRPVAILFLLQFNEFGGCDLSSGSRDIALMITSTMIILAMFTVLERIGDVLISWFPMYWELKLGFIIYLWHPKTKGSGYVYEKVLHPFMSRHEREIDTKLVEWEARAWDFASFNWQYCSEYAHVAFSRAMQYLAAQSRNFKSINPKEGRSHSSINRSMSGTPKSDSGEMNPVSAQTEYVYIEDQTEQQEVQDHEDTSPAKEDEKPHGHRLRRSHRTIDHHID